MTDREPFLERWSRKKGEAERDVPNAPVEPRAADVSQPDAAASPQRRATDDTKAGNQAAPKLDFDLASLPSLDSITAATDIRAFLAPGVPKELARAALRRAWSTDPAIRDFVGLAENAWDFTDPNAMAGFGALPPGYDIKKLVAQIFGESEKLVDADTAADEPADPQASHIVEKTMPPVPPAEGALPARSEAESISADISTDNQQLAKSGIVQCDNNIATHNSNPRNRRQHGGALPQ